jgi:predicted metal-dependent HD superfamily phosphohydrolase
VTPALEAAYAEPHRRYHTRRQIEQSLALLAEVPELTDRERRVLIWALWWHDAIYDALASDNEDRSAEMARRDLRDLDASLHERDEVGRLIRLTKGHQVEAGDRLGEILISVDLAILGAAPADYDAYAAQVREEYAAVPEAAWRPGRARVLQHFLDAPVIFPDPALRARFEVTARANLARELASLS